MDEPCSLRVSSGQAGDPSHCAPVISRRRRATVTTGKLVISAKIWGTRKKIRWQGSIASGDIAGGPGAEGIGRGGRFRAAAEARVTRWGGDRFRESFRGHYVIRISVLFYNLFRGMIVSAMAVKAGCMPPVASFDLHATTHQ